MTDTYRIRSADTWARARDDYLSGMGAEAVCHRYDLGLSAFRRRARKYGWRRSDQADPAPAELDLSIYEDIGPDDEVRMARLRFIQALNQGRSTEAARWRRLWHELRDELDAFHAEFYLGLSPAQIAARIAADEQAEDEEDDDAQDGAPALAAPACGALSAPAPTARPTEKVHNVHSVFSEPLPQANR